MTAEVLRMIPTKESVELDDRQLVEQIRHGDDGAFEMLVRRKTSKVYGLCYRVIGNSEDAKDISQLVFLKLWENLEKYDATYAFDTWLYRMVTNVAIDFLRTEILASKDWLKDCAKISPALKRFRLVSIRT